MDFLFFASKYSTSYTVVNMAPDSRIGGGGRGGEVAIEWQFFYLNPKKKSGIYTLKHFDFENPKCLFFAS